jgi:hypothetical protein
MPVRHHKEKFKNPAIMWLRQKTIEYRNGALEGVRIVSFSDKIYLT